MDDSMSTPISSIIQPVSNQPPPHMQQPYYQPQNPPPQEKSAFDPQDDPLSHTDRSQKELMFLFIIIVIATSEPVQRYLASVFPALFNDSKASIIANGIQAGIICAVFYFTRNMKIQFMI
jgi:hypothetical protein